MENLKTIIEQEMYCLVAPDGTPQPSSLAPDLATCMGFTKLLHKKGLGHSWHELKMRGFEYKKVKVSITSLRDYIN